MSPSTITLLFLLFAVVMFVLEKIPLGVTSMIVCIGLVVTGVLDAKSAFAGFVDSNVILFVAMFIVGGALFETGMANKIGGIVTRFARTEKMLIIAIMVIVGLMSGVLSNTGTAAVLIPVVIGIAAKSGYKRSRLLMPLVFAAAMGGNLSLIGAPGNMIAQSALEELNLKFGFFEYAIVGLQNVFFGYEKNKTIIHNLSLRAEAGKLVAIVGPTGAGKTTIINLLMRFYDVDEGSILVEGSDTREYTRRSLRGAYAMVLQDTWVFRGTIFDNIAYGKGLKTGYVSLGDRRN